MYNYDNLEDYFFGFGFFIFEIGFKKKKTKKFSAFIILECRVLFKVMNMIKQFFNHRVNNISKPSNLILFVKALMSDDS